ncbi:MAG: hypothetical protein WCI51_01070 [Lentisphaerota bacterium]
MPEEKITPEEIEKLILERGLKVEDVIDVVVKLNGFIGVGLISLADDIAGYIRSKIGGK